jgi:hypothetical protein
MASSEKDTVRVSAAERAPKLRDDPQSEGAVLIGRTNFSIQIEP